ncbi:MAG: DNA cytosine methyltransferase [Gemmatimonadaceae bacterium]
MSGAVPRYETVLKLTDQRGARRFFSRGQYLARAGFVVGAALAFHSAQGQVVITRVDAGSKHVHESKGLPTIDINERWLSLAVGDARRVHVRVEAGRIVLTVPVMDRAMAERPQNGKVGSLFTGAGFLDEAAVQAGFTPAWVVEIDAATAEVASRNHPEAAIYAMSIEHVVPSQLERCELILAGLPCTPWSKVRTTRADGTKRDYAAPPTDHALGDLAFAAYDVLRALQPRTILVECVPGLLHDSVGVALMGALRRIGYDVQARILNAADHGGLTKRERAVIVAQTPGADGSVQDPWPPVVPTTQCIADVLDGDVPDRAWVRRMESPHLFDRSASNREKGRGFVMRPTRATERATGTFTREYGEGRLRVDQPMLAHPTEPETVRPFTVTEGLRLMGMRTDYRLPSAKTVAWHLIGQAVHVGLFRQVISRATGRSMLSAANDPVVYVPPLEAETDSVLAPCGWSQLGLFG